MARTPGLSRHDSPLVRLEPGVLYDRAQGIFGCANLEVLSRHRRDLLPLRPPRRPSGDVFLARVGVTGDWLAAMVQRNGPGPTWQKRIL